ncbi:hypothetical protein VTN00DRAFT_8488 [Thermoascus crustaceus]|uniref:uncharacterized protein n=1 Tax=Thermoascus crustaceus TaxID=5088 RepID=UPI0037427A97
MTSTGPSPLPPTTILSTKSISQSSAHDFLAAYLARAASDPALQPNATVSEHGPVSHTTAAAPNLILHNLKRVQAGLAGEVLGRDLTFAKMGGDGDEESGQQDGQQQEGVNGGEGWQDREKWEQQDEADGGNGKNTEDNMEVDNETAPSGGIDKEERKRKKKERRQAEKRAKAKAAEAEE